MPSAAAHTGGYNTVCCIEILRAYSYCACVNTNSAAIEDSNIDGFTSSLGCVRYVEEYSRKMQLRVFNRFVSFGIFSEVVFSGFVSQV